jgi:hypothetical protein
MQGSQDAPPADGVLLELGRLVWAAINLEDVVYPICRSVQPRHGPFDDAPIGARIDEALKDLQNRPDDELRRRSDAWLVEAKAALAERNHVIHGTLSILIDVFENGPPVEAGRLLTHTPRNDRGGPVHTELSAEALEGIRRRLEQARDGWRELGPALWETRPRQ